MHPHGHWNKMVPLMKPYTWGAMALNFVIAPTSRLMTLEAIVSHIGSVTTTLAMKTRSSQAM
jgi:hypothetical protein